MKGAITNYTMQAIKGLKFYGSTYFLFYYHKKSHTLTIIPKIIHLPK